MDSEKRIVVIYHADCPDGFGSAWSAWKKLGDSALYIPVRHRTAPPPEIEGREVYTLDYCYPRDVIEAEILPKAKRLTVIDHHISSEPALPLAHETLYDIEHSGAVLSWKFFHPGQPIPKLLSYVEDVDLWRFKLPSSREVSHMTSLQQPNFLAWSDFAEKLEKPDSFQAIVEQGSVLSLKSEMVVAKVVDNAEQVVFEGYPCLMANAPFYISEIGAALVKKLPPIGLVWSRRKNRIVVSLRSDGTVDVNELASRHGGGGHHNAAAFSWDEEQFLNFGR